MSLLKIFHKGEKENGRLGSFISCRSMFRRLPKHFYLFIYCGVSAKTDEGLTINFGVKLFRVPVINKTPPKMLLFYFLYYQILMRSNERPINAELERIY
jgi:hypothetical protein